MNVLWPEARPVDMPNMDLKVDRPGDLEHIFFLVGFHPKNDGEKWGSGWLKYVFCLPNQQFSIILGMID